MMINAAIAQLQGRSTLLWFFISRLLGPITTILLLITHTKSAQKLYCKLGYISDRNGITYKNEYVIAGKEYPVDDDLILWLIKKL